ncbi:amidohydrolase [Spirosoma montaniterrae]|uniref:Amidohydrolase n=1 Tax=Spirosoma montaniterrae TaxID=1178516 RepID=A0A1P9X4J2_9BACT|nr:amidohydrolase family protein [Spirosoma montaniterrae]AQG82531.1 amidohydrolase [Spirosoma montaniterrae]
MRIDSHQHFWQYDPARHVWMSDDMPTLKTDFGPADLAPLLWTCSLDGCVAVQADQSEAENTYLLGLAQKHQFIRGIVGWVDLQADDLTDRLAYYQQFPAMKGFRHVLHDEPQRDFMLRPAFRRGIGQLARFGYTYDLLIFVDQMTYTLDLVRAFPDQPFVIDHIAKPYIRQGVMGEWATYLTQLATCPNVSCKISGLVTEADWHHWKPADFHPYLDAVVEAFGTDRIMYGSDWPVCTLAGTYADVYGLVADYFARFSQTEQDNFFGENAARFYGL